MQDCNGCRFDSKERKKITRNQTIDPLKFSQWLRSFHCNENAAATATATTYFFISSTGKKALHNEVFSLFKMK